MTSVNYFKQQAKLLLNDYRLFKENKFDQFILDADEPHKHFDVNNVLIKVNKQDKDDITLMKAQHYITIISGFKNWKELLSASSTKLVIGEIKLNAYKIGMDTDLIETAEMLVQSELLVDFGHGDYTDEDELKMWKYVLKRLPL